jgi:hypothetical protein
LPGGHGVAGQTQSDAAFSAALTHPLRKSGDVLVFTVPLTFAWAVDEEIFEKSRILAPGQRTAAAKASQIVIRRRRGWGFNSHKGIFGPAIGAAERRWWPVRHELNYARSQAPVLAVRTRSTVELN